MKMAEAKPAPKPKSVEAEESPAQRIKRLRDEAAALEKGEIDRIRTELDTLITELNGYGFAYRLTDQPEYIPPVQAPTVSKSKGRPPGSKNVSKKEVGESANYNPGQKCTTCNITGHDLRRHRNSPGKFTDDDLKRIGVFPPQVEPAQVQ